MFLTLLQNRRAAEDKADGEDSQRKDERMIIALLLIAGSP